MMEDCASLKIRSDLYSHRTSAATTLMTDLEQTTSQLSTHDNNRNIIEESSREPECDPKKDPTPQASTPQDWNPEEPCFVCTGSKPEDSDTSINEKDHQNNCSETAPRVDSPHISVDDVSSPSSRCNSPSSPREYTRDTNNSLLSAEIPSSQLHQKLLDEAHSPSTSLDLSTNRRSTHTSPRSQSNSPLQFEPYYPFSQENTGTSDTEVDQPFIPQLYPPNLPPQLIPWLISSQIQNFVNYQNRLDPNAASRETPKTSFIYEDKEQPLDLSAKKSPNPSLTEEELTNRVLEFKSSARGRKRADNNKKSYTEEELHAALKDILRGKLGTRKAAVHYGIPRSTLRNKMQKLTAMEKEKDKKLVEQIEKPQTHSPDSTRPFQEMIRVDQPLPGIEEPYGVLKTLLRSRMNDKLEELSRNSRLYLSGGDMQKFLDAAMTHLLDKIPELALNVDNRKTPAEVMSSLALYPQLHEFTNRIVEERFNEEILLVKSKLNEGLLSQTAADYKHVKLESPLNIPSYAPSLAYGTNNNNDILEKKPLSASQLYSFGQPKTNFKDVLTQIINHKMANEEMTSDQKVDVTAPPTLLPLPVHNLNMNYTSPLIKLPQDKSISEPSKKRAKSPSNSGGKGSRPKRGKYRNYDREKLLKAVEAVQTGEMSVHRAGTHFGVPHSTLEYKVKERHLHRDKKKPKIKSCSEPLPMHPPSSRTLSTRSEIPDTTTMEYQSHENSSSDDISVIGIRSNPHKRSHPGDDNNLSPPISTGASNPFLPNPFSFWNAQSPLIPSFLPRTYPHESIYTSPFIKNFREPSILSGLHNSVLNREPILREDQDTPPKPILNQPSPPPISSPVSTGLHESFFNNLLRRKMESQLVDGTISSQAARQPDANDAKERAELSPPHSSMIVLNQFLPSFLAARSSIAAALCSSADKAQVENDDSQDSQAKSLTLVNESSA